MSLVPPVRRPARREMITLEVLRRTRISPGFAVVTLRGPAAGRLEPAAPDRAVRLFFPRAGQDRLWMPTAAHEGWMAQLMMQPKSRRPWARVMTIRAERPDLQEVDIEVALHEGSPVSEWALTAAIGSNAGIFDEGATYRDGPQHRLLVADVTGLPAAAAILERATQDFRGHALLQVRSEDDIRPLPQLPGLEVAWIVNDDEVRLGAAPLLERLRATDLPRSGVSAWAVGERALPVAVRRHLVAERGVPKQDIVFVGYWRRGHSSPG